MITPRLLGRKGIWLGLAVCWTVIIAVLCLVSFDTLPKLVGEKGADKLGHISFHFVFVGLWYRYFAGQTPNALLKVFAASVFYGGTIEILQGLCTTTRQADWFDVAANSCGAVLAVVVFLVLGRYATPDPKIKS